MGAPQPAYFRRGLWKSTDPGRRSSRVRNRGGRLSAPPSMCPSETSLRLRSVVLRVRLGRLRDALTHGVGLVAVLAVLGLERGRVVRAVGLALLDRVEDAGVGGVVGRLRLRRNALAERVLPVLAGAVELVEGLDTVVGCESRIGVLVAARRA